MRIKLWAAIFTLVFFLFIGGGMLAKNEEGNFHVTTTKIDYNSTAKKINISMKFFTEDIENVISKNTSDVSFKNSLEFYVRSKFKLKVNGSSKSLQLIGVNTSQKTTWGYFEISNILSVESIEVRNEMLLNFSDQRNIMNFSANGQRKSIVGNNHKQTVKVAFN